MHVKMVLVVSNVLRTQTIQIRFNSYEFKWSLNITRKLLAIIPCFILFYTNLLAARIVWTAFAFVANESECKNNSHIKKKKEEMTRRKVQSVNEMRWAEGKHRHIDWNRTTCADARQFITQQSQSRSIIRQDYCHRNGSFIFFFFFAIGFCFVFPLRAWDVVYVGEMQPNPLL